MPADLRRFLLDAPKGLRPNAFAAAIGHWARSSNNTLAGTISTLAPGARLEEAQVLAAASAKRLAPEAVVRMLQAEAAARKLGAAGGTVSAHDVQRRVSAFRTLAAEHAEPPESAATTLPSQPSEPGRPIAAQPPASGTSASAAEPPPWNEERINAGIDKVAKDRGITAPAMVRVMKSLLIDPSMTVDQRAISLGITQSSVQSSVNKVRALIGNDSDNVRTRLAELVGMPFSEVVARIKAPDDPGLTKRVIDTVNPSHREAVAKSLLSVQSGSDRDVSIYRVMNAMFRGGDPFAAAVLLAKQLDQPVANMHSATVFLQGRFGGERIAMLRNMGFRHEQILSMSAVGAELGKRFDPALGTYSLAETTARRAKNLPCTREEAAERLLRAGTERTAGAVPLTYRAWIAIGLVSDRPASMPADVTQAFESIKPNAAKQAGGDELSRAFKVAQVLLKRDIPRGGRPDLMDRNYRQQINLLLCQTFGLGATRLRSGRLESIPTNFNISDWPAPNEPAVSSARRAPTTDQGADEVTWQELLPLLQRRSAN